MLNETDICIAYRDAKYKKHQIKILSELNTCSIKDIEDVLVKHGYELPAAGAKMKTRVPEKKSMPEKAAKSAKEEVTKAAEKEAAKAAGVEISGADIIELFKEKLKKLQEENERLNRELVNVYEFIKSV